MQPYKFYYICTGRFVKKFTFFADIQSYVWTWEKFNRCLGGKIKEESQQEFSKILYIIRLFERRYYPLYFCCRKLNISTLGEISSYLWT